MQVILSKMTVDFALNEFEALIDGGKWQHQPQRRDLDRRVHLLKKNSTLNAQPSVRIPRVNNGRFSSWLIRT